jgi:hypothetical protein
MKKQVVSFLERFNKDVHQFLNRVMAVPLRNAFPVIFNTEHRRVPVTASLAGYQESLAAYAGRILGLEAVWMVAIGAGVPARGPAFTTRSPLP